MCSNESDTLDKSSLYVLILLTHQIKVTLSKVCTKNIMKPRHFKGGLKGDFYLKLTLVKVTLRQRL